MGGAVRILYLVLFVKDCKVLPATPTMQQNPIKCKLQTMHQAYSTPPPSTTVLPPTPSSTSKTSMQGRTQTERQCKWNKPVASQQYPARGTCHRSMVHTSHRLFPNSLLLPQSWHFLPFYFLLWIDHRSAPRCWRGEGRSCGDNRCWNHDPRWGGEWRRRRMKRWCVLEMGEGWESVGCLKVEVSLYGEEINGRILTGSDGQGRKKGDDSKGLHGGEL